ncbi:MAG: glycosyltransferase [Gemmatimonadetes bacterium]|nr:glycosyltransferase [Gemmatimonadota bacterium]
MAEILVLASQIPIPVQATGTSLRLNPLLRHLAEEHEVDLVVFRDDRAERDALIDEAMAFCRSVTTLARPRLDGRRRLTRIVSGMIDRDRPPWELLDPFSNEAVAEVRDLVREGSYDVMFAVNAVWDAMFQLLVSGDTPPRVVLDWIDSPSLIHARRSRTRAGVAGWLARRRTRRVRRWQQRVNARVDAAIYIAASDREHAGAEGNPRVHVVPNGVLLPDRRVQAKSGGPPTLGFLGNMAYAPNELAALRLHERVFLPMRERVPELRLKIIGRDPGPELRRLASSSVEVTGEVDSIWTHLAGVDVMVFPMETGGGLQNKLLESLAADCCVVVTGVGAAGTGELGAQTLVIEDTDEGMIEATTNLLLDAEARATARQDGRRLLQAFDWSDILPRYARIILGP